jgi:hypothetical protein
MGNSCGECGKPFTEACKTKVCCRVHNAECFSCKPCTQPEAQGPLLKQCSLCPRHCETSELYYDYQCEK